MYKSLAPSVIKELEEQGEIELEPEDSTRSEWGFFNSWKAIRTKVYYSLGPEREHIFNCTAQEFDNTVQISNIEPAGILNEEEQGLVEAYLHIFVKAMIEVASDYCSQKNNIRLIFDSYLPCTPECLANLGFHLLPGSNLYRGYIKLRG